MQEKLLAACLKAGFKKGIPTTGRRRLVTKIPEWDLLEKPWKSLLLLALNETEIPSEDDENSTGGVRRMRGGRRRGGRGSNTTPMDWLPSAAEIIIDSSTPDSFRLAVLLIHNTLHKESWESDWDSSRDQLRIECSESGVHPVWQTMAEATPILAQFASFPTSETEVESNVSEINLDSVRIDPRDNKELKQTLTSLSSMVDEAKAQVALRRLISQLSANKPLKPESSLLNLEGPSSIISTLLEIAISDSECRAIERLAEVDKSLSEDYLDLKRLISGEIDNWELSRSAEGDDGLARSRRELAWQSAPSEAKKLSVEHLQEGIAILGDHPNVERVKWWTLAGLVDSGDIDKACNMLAELSLNKDSIIDDLLDQSTLMADQRASDWLLNQLEHLDEVSLLKVISMADLPAKIRLAAIHNLGTTDEETWESARPHAIDLFTSVSDIIGLSNALLQSESCGLQNPYEVLLCSHLYPAGSESSVWESLRESRRHAINVIDATEVPLPMSEAALSLLMLLEGRILDTKSVAEKLDKSGLLAFNECRQALKDGGDGIANTKSLENLSESVESGDFNELETKLMEAVINTLRLNRASWFLQSGSSGKEHVDLLDALLSSENTPMGMMHAVRHLVFEHNVALPNLIQWFQTNDPLSPWHSLARAAVHASNGRELNAAREYRRAADHDDFDFEQRVTLHRKALIMFAHAGQWNEAIELLESEPALKTALTKRFQLYLNVSNDSASHRTDVATRRLKDFVRRIRLVEEENQEGEKINVERTEYSEEELDLLSNYPLERPRPLPSEPFKGRVKAALNLVHKDRRRRRHSYENKYLTVMAGHSVSTEEIYEIASEAAAERPVDGLMFLERAQNSGKFSLTDLKRLAGAERTLFSIHNHDIPSSNRRYLHHLALTPLVIVDTNILIDAFHHRFSEKLDILSDSSLGFDGDRTFHRILLSKAKEGRIKLWLPGIVRQELMAITSNFDRIRSTYDDVLVDRSKLEGVLNEADVSKITEDVLNEFSTWSPMDLRLEEESNDSELVESLNAFLSEHSEVFDELTAHKNLVGITYRSEIDGLQIFPESSDQEIMRVCMNLASRPLHEIGVVLVATRDGDFTLIARALEERFGFGVVNHGRKLMSWLN